MPGLRLLVVSLALILSLGLGLQLVNPSVPFISPTVHAAVTDKITLTGCAIVMGSCTSAGWNGTTSSPNPTITVHQGDQVSIHLSSADLMTHQFQFDADNDGTADSADCPTVDPCSPKIPPTLTYTFTVPNVTPMTYTYFCIFHTTEMQGNLVVLPGITVGGAAASYNRPLPISLPLSLVSTIISLSILVATYGKRRQ